MFLPVVVDMPLFICFLPFVFRVSWWAGDVRVMCCDVQAVLVGSYIRVSRLLKREVFFKDGRQAQGVYLLLG